MRLGSGRVPLRHPRRQRLLPVVLRDSLLPQLQRMQPDHRRRRQGTYDSTLLTYLQARREPQRGPGKHSRGASQIP